MFKSIFILKARNVSTPSPQRGGASTCLNIRKKSDKNVFTTFTFRFQQYDHKLTNFSIKSYLENVQMLRIWSTNQNKLTKFAIFVFLPILRSCQFSFFGKKNANPLFFGKKLAKTTWWLVDEIQGFANNMLIFFFGEKKFQSTLFWQKNCQNYRVVGRQNPNFYQKYFRFLTKKMPIHSFLAEKLPKLLCRW